MWRDVFRRAALALAPCAMAGCAGLSNAPVPLVNYQPEAFAGTAHVRHFKVDPARTCEAARRALLSQGYVVALTQPDQVTAKKYFQPSAEHHVQLEFRVVCAAEGDEDDASVTFVSGLKEQYVVRKLKESASLGVGGIGSLSLPLEGSLDSMVKVGSETVTEPALYQQFFDLMGQYLGSAAPPGPSASAATGQDS